MWNKIWRKYGARMRQLPMDAIPQAIRRMQELGSGRAAPIQPSSRR